MAMLSFSSRPIASSFFLRPKRRPHRLLPTKPVASASALTPPVPRGDPATTGNPDADPTPLFLRPATHPVPASALDAFRRRASALVPPSAPHLHRHLRWLLADACAAADPASSGPDPALLLLRAPLDDLEALWLGHVRNRRPFQYVVGNEHWRDLVVAVREGVLIPRPETEVVVDMVKRVEGFAGGWWADLGTGSGAIAVAVARELGPGGRVFATDVSDVAIEVARLNVERYGVQDKVEIRKGPWFKPLEDVKGKLMGVISNPPYIPTEDLPGLQPEVGWHEPKLALDGGRDGLEHLLHLCEGLSSVLKPGGFFVFETNGNTQSEFLVDLISTKWSSSFRDLEPILDFADIKRFVTGYRRPFPFGNCDKTELASARSERLTTLSLCTAYPLRVKTHGGNIIVQVNHDISFTHLREYFREALDLYSSTAQGRSTPRQEPCTAVSTREMYVFGHLFCDASWVMTVI